MICFRSGICVKYFHSFPQKTCHQRKLRQTKCLLFNFDCIVAFPIFDPSILIESDFHRFIAALPRSESTPGLVESRGKVTLEEMWVSPMPLNSISHDKSSSDCT